MVTQRLICLTGLLLFSFTFVSAQTNPPVKAAAEKLKPLNFNDVAKVLVFASKITTPAAELNERLIKEIRRRKVNFLLNPEDENSLRTAGGSDLLIKTIRENLPEEIKQRIILYKKFVDNYDGKMIKQVEDAVKAAKEYIKKFSGEKEDKELIEYFRRILPDLEIILKRLTSKPSLPTKKKR